MVYCVDGSGRSGKVRTMKFKCGHEAAAGIGDKCLACFQLPPPIEPQKTSKKRRLKKKRHKLQHVFIDRPCFVIKLETGWRGLLGTAYPVDFSGARRYSTCAYAQKAVDQMKVKGTVMQRHETEGKTLQNHWAETFKKLNQIKEKGTV